MKLYLYKTGETVPSLEIEDVVSYTDNQVVTADGTVYGQLAAGCELSATADCAETLRAKYRAANPPMESRLEEMEALMAELLFGTSDGGEAE